MTRDDDDNNMMIMMMMMMIRIIIMAASSHFTYAMGFSVRIPSGFLWVVRMIDRITPAKTGLL